MKKRTNIEIAYDLLQTKGTSLPFFDLWQAIVNEHEYSETEGHDYISRFYTALLLDGRFVNLGDNTWDLRERVLFDDITLSVNEVYTDIDEDGEEDDEDAPEIIYFDEEGSEEDVETKVKTIVESDEKGE